MTETQAITLNEEQLKAVDNMLAWLFNKESSLFYCLVGSAGTGKTTTVKYFLGKARAEGFLGTIGVTAPTHKAKKVIANSTGLMACTIQLLLGLRPNVDIENFNPLLPEFEQLGDKKISEYKLIILDEASMCNRDLVDMLHKECFRYKTKILFMGDLRQLPPVGETISRCLTLPEKQTSKLNIVMRQEGDNPILDLTQAIIHDIDNDSNSLLKLLIKKPEAFNDKGKGYKVLTRQEFQQVAFSLFASDELNENHNYVKYIAYKNTTVENANEVIRAAKFPNEKKAIAVGDLLMAYNNVSKSIGISTDTVINNSAEYTVLRVTEDEFTEYVGYKEYTMKVFCTIVEDHNSGNIIHFNILDDRNEKNVSIYVNCLTHRLNLAKKLKGLAWKPYYNFRASVLVKRKIYNKNKEIVCNKDIDYNYGITVHKAQGSTYDNVCINLNNLLSNQLPHERNRLIYVAISRARSRCYLLYD